MSYKYDRKLYNLLAVFYELLTVLPEALVDVPSATELNMLTLTHYKRPCITPLWCHVQHECIAFYYTTFWFLNLKENLNGHLVGDM
jgi:hypothetical protein